MTHLSRSYTSEAKSEWRRLHAVAIKRLASKFPQQTLLDRSGKLRGRFLDLAGENTNEILQAYQRLLRSPSKLLLVDTVWDTYLEGLRNISHLPKEERPRVILNDAYGLAYSINQRTNANDNEELIGVFSLDLLNYASNDWWVTDGAPFIEYAVKPAIKEFKACVLLLNHTLDGQDGKGHEGAHSRIEAHIEGLRRTLSVMFRGGRDVPRGLLIPDEDEVREAIFNGRFNGWINRVHIYKSRTLRMATLRLYLQDGNFYACNKEDLAP